MKDYVYRVTVTEKIERGLGQPRFSREFTAARGKICEIIPPGEDGQIEIRVINSRKTRLFFFPSAELEIQEASRLLDKMAVITPSSIGPGEGEPQKLSYRRFLREQRRSLVGGRLIAPAL